MKERLHIIILIVINLSCYSQSNLDDFSIWFKGDKQNFTIDHYTKVIISEPNNAQAYDMRGLVKITLNDPTGAIMDFTKAIKIDPKNTEFYFHRGIAKLDLKNYTGALEDAKKYYEFNSSDLPGWYLMGLAKLGLQDYKGAISDFNALIDLFPDELNKKAYCKRGIAKMKINEKDSACIDFEKAEEFGDDEATMQINQYCPYPPIEGWHLRGNKRFRSKHYKGAIADYTRAIAVNPKDTVAFYRRGVSKAYINDYEGAIADFTSCITLNPEDKNTYYSRGLIKGGLSEVNSAIADFSKAIEIDPNYGEAYGQRGYLKILSGQKEGGCLDLNKSVDLETKGAKEYLDKYCK